MFTRNFQDGAADQIGFDRIGNSAIRSADRQNPNQTWSGSDDPNCRHLAIRDFPNERSVGRRSVVKLTPTAASLVVECSPLRVRWPV